MQICGDNGSCIFKRRLAMRVAHDPGSLLRHLFIHCSFIFHLDLSFLSVFLICIYLNRHKQNDLVHGWGLDFALRRCVEVPKRQLESCFFFFCHAEEKVYFVLVIKFVVWRNWCINAACTWEDRCSRFSMGRSSNCPFPWQPSKLFQCPSYSWCDINFFAQTLFSLLLAVGWGNRRQSAMARGNKLFLTSLRRVENCDMSNKDA